jgi:hypothetical protein
MEDVLLHVTPGHDTITSRTRMAFVATVAHQHTQISVEQNELLDTTSPS